MGVSWMPAVRREGWSEVNSGNWGARRQNFYWNVQEKKKNIAAIKQTRDVHHSFSSNEHKFYIKNVNFLLLL
jgi:hypothetical protein